MTQAETQQDRDARAITDLNRATDWLVQNGLYVLEHRDREFLVRKLAGEFDVQLFVHPLLDVAPQLAEFRIKVAGLNHVITDFFRVIDGGVSTDFWAVRKFSKEWETVDIAGCHFYVTRREGKGPALVVESSPTFIQRFATSGNNIAEPPQNDLRTAYVLRAWENPACFPNTHLPEWEIVIDADGSYRAVPAQPVSR